MSQLPPLTPGDGASVWSTPGSTPLRGHTDGSSTGAVALDLSSPLNSPLSTSRHLSFEPPEDVTLLERFQAPVDVPDRPRPFALDEAQLDVCVCVGVNEDVSLSGEPSAVEQTAATESVSLLSPPPRVARVDTTPLNRPTRKHTPCNCKKSKCLKLCVLLLMPGAVWLWSSHCVYTRVADVLLTSVLL